MPMKIAIEQTFNEITPLSFVLDVTDENKEPTFPSIGAEITALQETNMAGQPVSSAKPNTLMGQILETLSVVIDKKSSCDCQSENLNNNQDRNFLSVHFNAVKRCFREDQHCNGRD